MTLSARILSAIGLLGVILTASLVGDLVPAWRQAADTTRQQSANLASAALVEAAGALAVERGLTTGLLAAPAAATEALRQKITENRGNATDALARGLAASNEPTDPQLTAAMGRLDTLRRDSARADVKLAPGVWFADATAAIDGVVGLRRRIDTAASFEAEPTRLIALRDQLAEMSEFGGRLRGMINGLISRGGHASGPEAMAIGAINGRINGAWVAIETGMDSYPATIQQDVRTAGRAWNETFGPLSHQIVEAAGEGRDWPVPAAEWFQQASTAIDALLVAQAQRCCGGCCACATAYHG